VDWIRPVRDRDNWRDVVKEGIKFRGQCNA
jgi:hypothetical protein